MSFLVGFVMEILTMVALIVVVMEILTMVALIAVVWWKKN